MKTSIDGINLIKKFEGFSAVPYKDVGGKTTIGFGHLILPGEVFGALSSVEATALLERDVEEKAEKFINALVKVDLAQCEYDALASLVYNIGGGNFAKSTLLKVINSGEKEKAPQEFLKWCMAGGVTQKGLLVRRQKEANLFKGIS